MSRASIVRLWGLVILVCAIASSAFAQKPSSVNAALKARDQMLQSHRQSGSFAGGYRPFSTWSYQNSARTQTRALNAYGQNCPQVPPATAREHLTEIRKSVASATQELSKFTDEAAKQADVKEHVDTIKKHQEAAAKLCDRMEKAIGEEKVDCAEMCECCAGIDRELKAAEEEHRKLMDKIGIKLPDADAHEHGKHEHAPGEKTPVKEGEKKSD